MRTMKRVLTVAVMVSAGILFADGATEKGGDGSKVTQRQRCEMRDNRGCGVMLMKELNLTDEQRTAIKDLHEKNVKKMEAAREAVAEARKKLRDIATSKDVNEAAIKTTSSELADAMAAMALNKSNMVKEVKALLKPEQQEKFEKKMTEMKKRMQERMQEMRKKMEANRNKACKGGANKACGRGSKGGAGSSCGRGPKGNPGVKKSCCK